MGKSMLRFQKDEKGGGQGTPAPKPTPPPENPDQPRPDWGETVQKGWPPRPPQPEKKSGMIPTTAKITSQGSK